MLTNFTNVKVDLQRTGLLNLRAPAGLRVNCERGLIWVTVEGERSDHWLVAGESMTTDGSGRVVIEAAQSSRVALEQSAPPAWSKRFPRFLRKLTLQ